MLVILYTSLTIHFLLQLPEYNIVCYKPLIHRDINTSLSFSLSLTHTNHTHTQMYVHTYVNTKMLKTHFPVCAISTFFNDIFGIIFYEGRLKCSDQPTVVIFIFLISYRDYSFHCQALVIY